MRVSRALLECLVFAASTSVAFGQSVEPLTEPLLGPAVPLSSELNPTPVPRITFTEPELGPIIPISGTLAGEGDRSSPSPLTFPKDDVQYLSGAEAMPNLHFGFVPIRVIGHPMVAPLIEPNPTGFSRAYSGPVHPDQIQFHLSSLAEHFNVSGLRGEAKRIQELQQQFQRDHYQRLLIAHKESQLKGLQVEIANLKQNQKPVAAESQISLRVRIVELNQDACEAFLQKLANSDASSNDGEPVRLNQENLGLGFLRFVEVDTYAVENLLIQLCENGSAKIVAEPSATVLNGRNVRFLTGGEIAVPNANPVEGQTQNSVSFRSIGTSVLASPHVIDSNNVRLGIILERNELDPRNTVGTVPGISTRRYETVVELASGKTIAAISQKSNDQKGEGQQDELTSQLILIVPEIVNPSTSPFRSQPEPPTSVPTLIYHRPVIEAKAVGTK